MLLTLWRKLFKPRRFHDRANGHVTINPEKSEVIHVYGKAPKA